MSYPAAGRPRPAIGALRDSVKTDLRLDEGLRLKCYKCSEGRTTIGFGRNVEDKGISRAEAEHLLDNDVTEVIADLDRLLPWWRTLSFDQQRGLANLAYQLGLPKLLQFKRMLGALEAHDGKKAAEYALDSLWARQTPERARRVAHLLERG